MQLRRRLVGDHRAGGCAEECSGQALEVGGRAAGRAEHADGEAIEHPAVEGAVDSSGGDARFQQLGSGDHTVL
jgi:hypothetical protein